MCQNCDARDGVDTMDNKTLVETDLGTYLVSTISVYDTIQTLLNGRTYGDNKFQSTVLFLGNRCCMDVELFQTEVMDILDSALETDNWSHVEEVSQYTRCYTNEADAEKGHDELVDLAKVDSVGHMTVREQSDVTFRDLSGLDIVEKFSEILGSMD